MTLLFPLLAGCAQPDPRPVAVDDAPVAPKGEHPNLLLVSMDTVRFDHTSLGNGGARETTPNLAGLATRGTAFSHAYAVGNESLYSHAAILTGRYPSEIAVPDYASFALNDSVPNLAGVLGAYGYDTAAFTGAGHIIATFGFNLGFGSFNAAKSGRFASFFDSVPPAIAWMRSEKDHPWFLFVHGYDAHSPYVAKGPFLHPFGTVGATPRVERLVADPLATEQIRAPYWFPGRTPDDFAHAAGRQVLGTDFYTLPAEPMAGEQVETLSADELQHIRDHYDSGLLYGDFWLGLLLAHVDLDHTLVIVLADHGEDVLDHGYMNHRSGLWDSTTHVPLVVAGPGIPAGVVEDGFIDLRSVLPTFLGAAGATLPAGVVATPLGAVEHAERTVFTEGVMDEVSARSALGRLTIRKAQLATGAPDLATLPLTDPRVRYTPPGSDQDRAVGPQDLEAATALRAALVEWRAGLHLATRPGADVPDSLREALRARGYWTPEKEP